MNILMQDLRFGLRLLLKNPGFAIGAIVTLALGIGANTAIFSVVDGVLLRPLPYPDPDRIVRIYGTDEQGRIHENLSPMDFEDWRDQSASFESLGAYSTDRLTDTGGEEPEQLTGLRVTPGFFSVLGVGAAAGRTLVGKEGIANAPPSIVLSHALWQRRFAGDPAILGETVTFEEGAYTVVGVMPADFISLVDADQLEQLLINLLRNAVDAALETDGAVRVGWKKTTTHLEVWVEDEGPGLSITSNLFVPLFHHQAQRLRHRPGAQPADRRGPRRHPHRHEPPLRARL